ncbi:hypothetical protein COCMIDRAFT_3673 [Bipolaris oryzae ATCC 44560]|uniref:Uncharacterized protein n=1 Tax=Bipolaris oryzae ATCC 44560 TaxID=930090 RepID=W6ZUH7_COCMI|nr:uncharacterized protein COCMIDRAFT_3673 [Bipolaris oryzae ATCC 44560]EUC47421.1 hypothetical protein COCMIDRAFT_3673 [Bipolaris oryzae ATCC 44560]
MERVRKICTLCKVERQFEHSTRRDTNCPILRTSRGNANSRAQNGRKVFTHDITRTNVPLKKRNTLRKKNRSAATSTQGAINPIEQQITGLQITVKDRSATRQSKKEVPGATKSAWLHTWFNRLPITTCPKPPISPSSSTSLPPRKATNVDLSRVVPSHRTEESPTALPTNITPTAPIPHRTRIPPAIKSSSTPNLSRHFSLSKKSNNPMKNTTPTTTTTTTTIITPSAPTKLQKRAPASPRPRSTTITTAATKTYLFPPHPTSTVLRPCPTAASDSNPTSKRPQTHNPDLHQEPSKEPVVTSDGRNSTAYLTIAAAAAGEEEDDDDDEGEFEMSETRRLLWEYWNVQCRFLVEEWIDE